MKSEDVTPIPLSYNNMIELDLLDDKDVNIPVSTFVMVRLPPFLNH